MDANFRVHKSPFLLLVLLTILALAAGAFLAYCTDYAPWGFSDSAAYFSAAHNLAAGHSLSVSTVNGGYAPFNLHAPLYSLVLAVFAKFNANLIHVSKIMDIGLWTLFVFLCGWLFFKITGWQMEACFFALACAFSTSLVTSFTSLMSEPLALALGIPGFLLLVWSVKSGSRLILILSSLCIGLSVLSRFAFSALLGAGFLVLLILSSQPWIKRWFDLLVFGLIGAAPIGLWTVIQHFQHVKAGGRSLIFADVFSKLRNFAALVWNTLKYWVPYRSNMIPGVPAKYFSPLLILAFAMLVFAGFWIAVRGHKRLVIKDPAFLLAVSSILFLVVYFAVLLAGFAFSSEPNDINDRILTPIMPALFALLLSAAIMAGSRFKKPITVHMLAAVVTLFFVVFNFNLLRSYGINSSRYPNGYTSPDWNGSRIFEIVTKLPEETPLISNAPNITLFYANRLPYCLTENPTNRSDCLSTADRAQLQDFVEKKCAVLILFPASLANHYENYKDPVSQFSMNNLTNTYPVLFQAAPEVILYYPECTALKESLAGE